METIRENVLSIAGYDPCAGAGVLADIKTFEQHKVYGHAVCTALTAQHESAFFAIQWTELAFILKQINALEDYNFSYCKIGIIENWAVLKTVCLHLKKCFPNIKIILDPIFRASAGFDFQEDIAKEELLSLLQHIELITPNAVELARLFPERPLKEAAATLAKYCAVLFKGGHNKEELGTDYLYYQDKVLRLEAIPSTDYSPKHGSGCVLSAAITAQLAQGLKLDLACVKAKEYISHYLCSSKGLLGYHNT